MSWPKGYIPPEEEILAFIDDIMSVSADNMAYEQPANKQFYYINNCKRVIRALCRKNNIDIGVK